MKEELHISTCIYGREFPQTSHNPIMSSYNKYIFFLASSPLLKKDIYNYTIHLRSNIALPLFLYISLENVDIFMFHPNNNHYNFRMVSYY